MVVALPAQNGAAHAQVLTPKSAFHAPAPVPRLTRLRAALYARCDAMAAYAAWSIVAWGLRIRLLAASLRQWRHQRWVGSWILPYDNALRADALDEKRS